MIFGGAVRKHRFVTEEMILCWILAYDIWRNLRAIRFVTKESILFWIIAYKLRRNILAFHFVTKETIYCEFSRIN